MSADIAERVTHHADTILKAAGSGLRHYSMDRTRRAILSAAMDAWEEAYRAGAESATEVIKAHYAAKTTGAA